MMRAKLMLGVLTLAACAGFARASAPAASASDRELFAPALTSAPLAGPFDVAGGFCEYRRGHFHAGFDLSTERRVGRPVLAPLSGTLERVRASGVGYGRSLYLRGDDGRLLVFGHLDAFAEPIAAYVRAVQDSSGQYEQDLWPAAGRFRFRAGETIAWTGESGAGGPHLHFEIRRGDVAYHPGRAGLAVADSSPPSLTELTLEPLDAHSRVVGSAGPRTFTLARAETIDVIGRVRAMVVARDGIWAGVDRMVPWEVGMEWNGERVTCRFDSVSWATDMEQGDQVYDAGRVLDSKAIVLWSRAGFRPRAFMTSAPRDAEAGTIHVRAGDPPRKLKLWARDLGGGRYEREVVLRPARRKLEDAPVAVLRGGEGWGDPALGFAALPGGAVRLTLSATQARLGADFAWGTHTSRASRGFAGWSSVFAVAAVDSERVDIRWHEPRGGVHHGAARAWHVSPLAPRELRELAGERTLQVPAGALFDDATLVAFTVPVVASGELESLGDAWRVEPERLPLQRSVTVSAPVPAGVSTRGLGLYRRSEGDWQWIGGADDSTTDQVKATSSKLGAFALFRDARAPRVVRTQVVRDTLGLPYSRWAYEAILEESGSGVVARACWFESDGRRVPTEWDPEANALRWRPATLPAPGEHRVRIVTADRAGNTASVEDRLVVGR
ncbi:MAG: M23 family metallopeptidase [Candidatus Eisenbacteria bacterium]